MIDGNFPYKVIGVAYFGDGHMEAITVVDYLSDTYVKFVAESGTYVYRKYGIESEPVEVKNAGDGVHRLLIPQHAFEKHDYDPLIGLQVYTADIDRIEISKAFIDYYTQLHKGEEK